MEGIDREVDSVEVQKESFYTGKVKYETVMETDCKETTEMTGTLPTSGLFDDLGKRQYSKCNGCLVLTLQQAVLIDVIVSSSRSE